MSSSRPHVDKDEFYLASPTLKVMADVNLSDEEGEQLWHDIEPKLEGMLDAIKKNLEAEYPRLRVGYDVG